MKEKIFKSSGNVFRDMGLKDADKLLKEAERREVKRAKKRRKQQRD